MRWGRNRQDVTKVIVLSVLSVFSIRIPNVKHVWHLRWTCIISLICKCKPRTWNSGSAESASMWQHTVCQNWCKTLFVYKKKLLQLFYWFFLVMSSYSFLLYPHTSKRWNHFAIVCHRQRKFIWALSVCLFIVQRGERLGSAMKQHLDGILLARWTAGTSQLEGQWLFNILVSCASLLFLLFYLSNHYDSVLITLSCFYSVPDQHKAALYVFSLTYKIHIQLYF